MTDKSTVTETIFGAIVGMLGGFVILMWVGGIIG